MAEIEFSKDEIETLVQRLKRYFADELDQDIKQFEAEFLLAFFTEQIGPYFYNRGLHDAQAILEYRIEAIAEAICEIEKPTEFLR